MEKVPRHLGPRKAKYRREADAVLLGLAKEFISETELGRRETARKALSEYLGGLNDQEVDHVSREWLLLPREDQDAVYTAFHALKGLNGPPGKLMKALSQARDKLIDSLPEVSDPSEREIEAHLRELAIADGASPEAADGAVSNWRRQGKWGAACDVLASAELEAGKLAQNNELRAILPEVARLSDRLAKRVGILRLHPDQAAAMRDGLMMEVLDALGKAELAGASHSLRDSGLAALHMLQAFADGKTHDPRWIEATAGDLRSVAMLCRTAADSAPRARKRPRKPALDCADALEAGGRNSYQVAVILNERGLRLNPHTPRNISKSIDARRREQKRK